MPHPFACYTNRGLPALQMKNSYFSTQMSDDRHHCAYYTLSSSNQNSPPNLGIIVSYPLVHFALFVVCHFNSSLLLQASTF
jgi:hypothetical protein